MKPDEELIRNLMIGLECFFFLLIEDDSFSDKKKVVFRKKKQNKTKNSCIIKTRILISN